ncbi:hypothetical protein E3Q23_01430, partial [Wallemia mellicola]
PSVSSSQTTVHTVVNGNTNEKDNRCIEFVKVEEQDDPMQWPRWKKMKVAIATVGFSVFVSSATSTFAQGIYQMNWGMFAMGIYVVAFAFPPMLLAGLSEEYGRNKLYGISYLLYMLFFLPVALSPTIYGVIIARLLQGFAASTGSTITAGSISDMYTGYERGIWMSIFAASAPFSTGVAPVAYSYVPQMYEMHFKGSKGVGGWRWIQIIQLLVVAAWGIVMFAWVRETRLNVIMKAKAKRLRQETGNNNLRAESEVYKLTKKEMFRKSLFRPLKFVATEPIVQVFSLFIGFAWAVFFSLQASISHVFLTLYSENYGMNHGSVGFVFIAIIIGTVCGFTFNFYFQEKWFYHRFQKSASVEARLGSAMISGLIFPIGAFIYAFTTYDFVHWIAPCIAIAVIMMGIFPIYYSSMNYLSDCYMTNASSALAAIAMVRNLTGGIIQFVITQWLDGLGDRFQYPLLMIAVMATVLGGIPIVLFIWGKRIRQRSKYASVLTDKGLKEDEVIVQEKVHHGRRLSISQA